MKRIYGWAAFVFVAALVLAWCLGQALQKGNGLGSVAFFTMWLACALWLDYLRYEDAR